MNRATNRHLLLITRISFTFGLSLCWATSTFSAVPDYKQQRMQLVDNIVNYGYNMDDRYPFDNNFNQSVIDVLRTVPRHLFVPESQQQYAYENHPLPIGYGQTISQPYIVALMTDILELEATDVVLEIGTGSGFQAAVLAELVKTVYTVEVVPELYEQATKRLEALKYPSIQVKLGDGYYGWAEHGPFNKIIVTAASSHIPIPLIQQLKDGGKMVIPVGNPYMVQELVLVNKTESGDVIVEQQLPVRFVPLISDGAEKLE